MMLLLLLPVKLQRVMKSFATSMLRSQELKSIFIYLFQETLIAMAVRFTDPLLTILMMAKTYMIHAVKQKKGGGSPQCHLRYQAGILGHSMTEMKAFFTSSFNTLKIRSIVLRLHFEYL